MHVVSVWAVVVVIYSALGDVLPSCKRGVEGTVSVRAVLVRAVSVWAVVVVIYSALRDALPSCKRGVEHTVFAQAVDPIVG